MIKVIAYFVGLKLLESTGLCVVIAIAYLIGFFWMDDVAGRIWSGILIMLITVLVAILLVALIRANWRKAKRLAGR